MIVARTGNVFLLWFYACVAMSAATLGALQYLLRQRFERFDIAGESASATVTH
jgi:hypothetical protein